MSKAKEIEGVVYRVKHLTGGWLVEVPETEDPVEALAKFAAEKSVKGYIITSVTRIFACSTDTPRMAILSSKEFKSEVSRLMKEQDERGQRGPVETLDELKDRIYAAGWSCSELRDDDTGEVGLEIGQTSPAGENFYIYISGKTVEELVDNLNSQEFYFDEDEHVKLIMDANGAPDLATLVKDAADIHEMLRKLTDMVSGQ